MAHLVKLSGGKAEIIPAKSFEREFDLQELVNKHPEILDDLSDEFSRILIIGCEFAAGSAGLIDLLGIDADGLITIIEFKLEKNTDIRKAIAQTVEYAANLWEMSYSEFDDEVKKFFAGDRCKLKELKNLSLAEAIAWHYARNGNDDAPKFSCEDFVETVKNNLRNGQFRLILFCDAVDERTKRTVEYLNLLSRFDIYCASADFFWDGPTQYIKTHLVTTDRQEKGTKQYAGKLTLQEFLESLSEKYDDFVPPTDAFVKGVKEHGGFLNMGSKGFAAYLHPEQGNLKLLDLYPHAAWIITMKGFLQLPFLTEEHMKDLKERLKGHPDFLDAFVKPKKMAQVLLKDITPAEFSAYLDALLVWYKRWFMNDASALGRS